jgi:hypothetical protein
MTDDRRMVRRMVDADLFGAVERVDVMAHPVTGRPGVVLCVHGPGERHTYVELDDRTLDALVEGRIARDELMRGAVH